MQPGDDGEADQAVVVHDLEPVAVGVCTMLFGHTVIIGQQLLDAAAPEAEEKMGRVVAESVQVVVDDDLIENAPPRPVAFLVWKNQRPCG